MSIICIVRRHRYDPTTVVTGLIHLHFVHWPITIWPLDNPQRDYGLVGAHNYRVHSGDAELGLWHVRFIS